MMEQSYSCEGHGDAIFVAGLDDVVVANAATRLCHILHARLVCPLDIVAKREKGVSISGGASVDSH